MPSLTAKDRAPLCLFSYEDGRRCCTPRTASHPHFCFYHAQKESQSQAAEKLSEDLAYFFSGDYISANDLSTALSRLIPAVVRGEIKPRLARTLAYMFQIQLQAIHLSQREYVNAFGADGWRKALRSSVTSNADYLYPPNPAAQTDESDPAQTAPTTPVGARLVHPEPRRARPASPTQASSQSAPEPAPAAPVRAGLARPASPTQPDLASRHPSHPPQSSPQPPSSARPSAADTEAALNVARTLFPRRPNPTTTQPNAAAVSTPASTVCHPVHPEDRRERSEGPCPNPTQPPTDETHHPVAAASPQANPTPNPATPPQTAQPTDPTPPPQPSASRRQPGAPTRNPYAVHFDHNYRLYVDGKPW
jgi:hypothetical protein